MARSRTPTALTVDFQALFIPPPAQSVLYQGSHDPVLVGFSVAVAILAAYAALLVAQHVARTQHAGARHLWTLAGGVCLGFGIWAMHFIGMLAFSLPCRSSFDSQLTLLSMVPAVLSSVLALRSISRRHLSRTQLLQAGLLIGVGVGAMHYGGMAAMRIDGQIRYNPVLFALSLVVAVALATLALWLKFRLSALLGGDNFRSTASGAVVLGLAVSGMHYTAMLAAYFVQDGQSNAGDGMAASMLAALVLLISGLIIVATLFATYIELPSLLSFRRSLRGISLLALGWTTMVWLGSGNYYGRLAAEHYQQQERAAIAQVNHVADNINHSLQVLRGIAQTFADHPQSQLILRRFGPLSPSDGDTQAQRRQRWSLDPELSPFNRQLADWARYLGADVIWLMNAAGDTVAASNADQPESFVGGNFADRQYFQQARQGQLGQQYAVGRISGAAGLFFSAPVQSDGKFLGAVVVKRNLSNFSGWTRQLTAFLTDVNDVIILSEKPAWELLALPGAAALQLAPEQRLALYRRESLDKLAVRAWDHVQEHPLAVLLGDDPQPRLLSSLPLADAGLRLHVALPLSELAHGKTERLWLFFLLAAAGNLLIFSASAVVIYLRESRQMHAEQRVAATAFESQQGMLITDADQRILRVNQAFTDITGFASADVLGHRPQMLYVADPDGALEQSIHDELTQRGVWHGEMLGRHKDGTLFPQWLMMTAVRDDAGVVTHHVLVLTDITERRQAEEEINKLAFYDPLTGLPNRRLLLDRLAHALAASARTGRHGALLFIDLDNFKDLNDNKGHQVGDLLLQQVAQRLMSCTRQGDSAARLGGDEFVLMLEDMSTQAQEAAEQAQVVGEKVLTTLNSPYSLAGFSHHSTPSIGVALFSGQQADMDDLLKRADLAMYQAKAAGRNTLCFFDPAMQAVASQRAALEIDLRNAIAQAQFELYYQVQVDHLGSTLGAEVLLRWHHPVRGMVPPAEFIALAESSGLILPLGRWVLQSACQQLTRWAQQARLADLVISVNVSARQFRHPDFVDDVLTVLTQTAAPPHRLKLELTESLLVNDVEDIIAKMTQLKAHGVGFSLDDFGTGYSSLSYLKRLPLDQLKIDQGFVRDILIDPNDAAIAKMVIALAESMGLAVIAEGVELVAQRDFLAHLGCLAYQGYLYGRPVPLADFEDRVA